MITSLLKNIFRRKHYWRTISFDEMVELYAARMLTVFALGFMGMFVGVYLWRLGYSLTFIFLMYGSFFLLRALFVPIAAHLVARLGPKHAIMYGNILQIPGLVALALVETYQLPAILCFGVFFNTSLAIHNIGYLANFSKIKHAKKAGKELGYMDIIEKTTSVISPLVGGVVASFVSPVLSVVIAAVFFLIAATPLMMSREQVRPMRHFRVFSISPRHIWREIVARGVTSIDYSMIVFVWPLFLSTVLFAGAGQQIYAIVGMFGSLELAIAVVIAWFFGRSVDKHHGGTLLRISALASGATNALRAIVAGPFGVIAAGIGSEIAVTSSKLTIFRTIFDTADSSGHRISVVSQTEAAAYLGCSVGFFITGLCVVLLGDAVGMLTAFIITGVLQSLQLVLYKKAQLV